MSSLITQCGYDPAGKSAFSPLNPVSQFNRGSTHDISELVHRIVTQHFQYQGRQPYTLTLYSHEMILELSDSPVRQEFGRLTLKDNQWSFKKVDDISTPTNQGQISTDLQGVLQRVGMAWKTAQSNQPQPSEENNSSPTVINQILCGCKQETTNVLLQAVLELGKMTSRLTDLLDKLSHRHDESLLATCKDLAQQLRDLQEEIKKLKNPAHSGTSHNNPANSLVPEQKNMRDEPSLTSHTPEPKGSSQDPAPSKIREYPDSLPLPSLSLAQDTVAKANQLKLKEQIATLQTQLQAAQQSKAIAQETLSDQKQVLGAAEKQLQTLKDQMAQLQGQGHADKVILETQIKNLQTEKEALAKSVEMQKQKLSVVEKALAEALAHQQNSKLEMAELNKIIQRQIKELEEKKRQAQGLKTLTEDLLDQLEQQSLGNISASEGTITLSKKEKEIIGASEIQRQLLAKTQEDLAEALAQNKKLEEMQKHQAQSIETLQAQLVVAQQTLNKAHQQIAALEKDVQQKTQELEDSKNNIQGLEDEIAQLRRQNQDDTAALEEKIAELQAAKNGLEKEIQELQQHLAQKQEELATSQVRKGQLTDQNKKILASENLAQTVDQQAQHLQKNQARIKRLEDLAQELGDHLQSTLLKVKNLESTNSSLTEKLGIYEISHTNLEQRDKEAQELQEERVQLQEKLDIAQQQNSYDKLFIQDISAQLAKTQSEIKRLRIENDTNHASQAQITLLKQRIIKTESELSQAKQEGNNKLRWQYENVVSRYNETLRDLELADNKAEELSHYYAQKMVDANQTLANVEKSYAADFKEFCQVSNELEQEQQKEIKQLQAKLQEVTAELATLQQHSKPLVVTPPETPAPAPGVITPPLPSAHLPPTAPHATLQNTRNALEQLNNALQVLAKEDSISSTLAGPVINNLAFLEKPFFEKPEDYKPWIRSNLDVSVSEDMLNRLSTSVYSHQKIASSSTRQPARAMNLDALRGQLTTVLQKDDLLTALSNIKGETSLQTFFTHPKFSRLAQELIDLKAKLNFFLEQYKTLSADAPKPKKQMTQKSRLAPGPLDRFKEAEELIQTIDSALDSMKKALSAKKWKIKENTAPLSRSKKAVSVH